MLTTRRPGFAGQFIFPGHRGGGPFFLHANMKTIPFSCIGSADSAVALLTDANGYDVATLSLVDPKGLDPDHPAHRFTAEDWQAVIDTVHAAPRLAAACHGLDLPETVPPGILAELVTAARDVARMGPGAGGTFPALEHVLAKLAPVSPEIPEAVKAAFVEVWRYCPEVCHVRFYDDGDGFQGWEFSDPQENRPEFPDELDTAILDEALDWVAEHGGFPQSFELCNPEN